MADTLLATPDDLGVYLNDGSIQAERAFLMIQLAQDLCESVVSPLPATAKGIVLRIAARKYVSSTSTRAQQLAAGGSPMGSGSLPDLTRSDKADLRRLAGGGGAFSIDTLPAGYALPADLPYQDVDAVISDQGPVA